MTIQTSITLIPETAPFTATERSLLNAYFTRVFHGGHSIPVHSKRPHRRPFAYLFYEKVLLCLAFCEQRFHPAGRWPSSAPFLAVWPSVLGRLFAFSTLGLARAALAVGILALR